MSERPPGANREVERMVRGRKVMVWEFDSTFPIIQPERKARPEKDDRQLHRERLEKEEVDRVEYERIRAHKKTITRKIMSSTDPKAKEVDIFGVKLKFPVVIKMGCGSQLTIQEPEDLPSKSVKCPCRDEHCYFLEFE